MTEEFGVVSREPVCGPADESSPGIRQKGGHVMAHEHGEGMTVADLPCCPELGECDRCETLDIRYRLPFRPRGRLAAQARVEVILRFRLERCPGPLTLGDIIYTTTLLPGEQVRLFTSDRHTRFTYDSETNMAYRHATASEESFFMTGMASAMSSLDIVENVNASSTFESSSVSGGGGLSVDLFGIVEVGGSVNASGYDSESTSEFARELSQHAQSTSRHVEAGVRAASSTSVGEVESRTHVETESEDQFESASRVFSNPNHCHALSFYFHRLMKCQTVRFELIGVDRRVIDPGAPTVVRPKPPIPTGGVSVVPHGVVATAKQRLEAERRARASVLERERAASALTAVFTGARAVAAESVATDVRQQVLKEVDKELTAVGLLDESGEVSKEAKERFGWERTVLLPTPGVVVKGCLDECNICEPELQTRIELENKLLERQIELLEKSQEYRCCPAGSVEAGGGGGGEPTP